MLNQSRGKLKKLWKEIGLCNMHHWLRGDERLWLNKLLFTDTEKRL